MKVRFTAAVLLVAVVVALSATAVAFAGGTGDIIDDAANGTIDGTYTAAQVEAALAYLKSNPTFSQYSDAQGVLEDYLASLGAPGAAGVAAAGGELAFTGADTVLILGAGLALVAGGVVLRRRVRA
jgi:hypothetical protein